MRNIEVAVLNPEVLSTCEKMAAAMARLTQRGHTVNSLADFMELYNKPASEKFVHSLGNLPHPTLQKFGTVNVIIIGASRRFLAQITRHQNEVKFMSASLQYSDYSGAANFAVPYAMLDSAGEELYLRDCKNQLINYQDAIEAGADNDSAGYLMPQGMRNVLLISATPYQWKHMINQRVCRRNTDETRIVMLKIWAELRKICPAFFTDNGPFCMTGKCLEGKMGCRDPISRGYSPLDILAVDYPKIAEPTPLSEIHQMSFFEEETK